MKTDTIDLLISFDTTGSMYPCLTQVRRGCKQLVKDLFDRVPNLRIGVISHGDYCDGTQKIKTLDLTSNSNSVISFIDNAPQTSGGDEDKCYELVLNEARKFSWTAGKNKAMILIGDCNPHPMSYRDCKHDWRNEAKLLVEAGISIYPVQALGRSHCTRFYNELAKISGTPKLDLPQFSDISDIICGVCYHQAGPSQFQQFEQEFSRRKHKSPTVLRTLALLSGKPLSAKSETIGSRFQVLEVDHDCSIQDFVISNGLTFRPGRGFYEFTKTEEIQEYKEVVAQNLESGAIIEGKMARKALMIPEGRSKCKPCVSNYIGFIQSTSNNRKLKGGTKFLYEINETFGTY